MRLILTAWVLFAFAQIAHATEFAVSPMLINLEGDGGQSQTFEIAVAGKSDGRIRLAAYAMTQELSGHMSFSETDFNPAQHVALNWIRFEKERYDLKAGETTIVRGQVSVPRDAKGTHLAAIMVEEDPEQSSRNIAIKVRYAVILNINVGSPPHRMLTAFTDARLLEVDDRTIIEASFSNQNAYMGFLKSEVQIRDGNRKLVARLALRTESAWQRGDDATRVYPGATVKLYAELSQPLLTGDYNLLARNSFNGKLQPIYRDSLSFVSTAQDVPFEDLNFLTTDRLVVTQRSSGLSLTPLSITNPSAEEVTIKMPSPGSDVSAGVAGFEFIPAEIRLKPRMTRKVMLKQRHLAGSEYKGAEFVIAAIKPNGVSAAQTLQTVAMEAK